MGKLVKRLGGWMRRGEQSAVGADVDFASPRIVLFEDLWPLCFVPETGRRERPAASLSAGLPSAEAATR